MIESSNEMQKTNNHTGVLIYFGVVIFILLFNLIIQAIYITFFKAIGVKIVVAITTMTIGGNMAASIKPIA